YVVFTIGFILIGRVWFEGFGSIATFLGLITAGIAIALKDPLTNLAGWRLYSSENLLP
ncbi:MAG: mechanosensitive ion channel, partial [Ignavibacteriaceae bacterium]|nr:mechanosensitive ion channel [Ignavibacteriaceae bacterium]